MFFIFGTLLVHLLVYEVSAFLDDNGNCTVKGLQCTQDCLSVGICNTVGVKPNFQISCDTNEKCTEETGDAVCQVGATCTKKLDVICGVVGEIPDPTDCTKFYICTAADGGPPFGSAFPCPENQYWDTKTKSCISGTCMRKPATCNPLTGSIDQFCYYCSSQKNILVYLGCSDHTMTSTTEAPTTTSLGTTSSPSTVTPTTLSPSTSNAPGTTLTTTTPLPPTVMTSTTAAPPGSSTENPATLCQSSTASKPTCSKAGLVYPMAGYCRCYWECNSARIAEGKPCALGFYFDSTRFACVFDRSGICV